MAEYNIPGVYSDIDASAAITSLSPNANVIGIVATADTGDDNVAYAPISIRDAISKYGSNSNLIKLMQTASENGAGNFILVKVESTGDTTDYQAAFDVLAQEEAVDIVIMDSVEKSEVEIMKAHLRAASKNRKERIGVIGFEEGAEAPEVIAETKGYNEGRMFASYPNLLDSNGDEVSGIFNAAALAGIFAEETDPSMPMTNAEISGFYGTAIKLEDDEMDALIVGGIIPIESINGNISIVRAISTYTTDVEGTPDTTWQELTTTRISDYIFKDLRTRLRRNYARARQGKATRDSIKSEVISSLLQYEELEYIENVDTSKDVSININPFDPLRNDVYFKYDVTGPLNVIHLTGALVI